MNNETQGLPASVPSVAAMSTEQELLAGWGFTAEEIASLLWLQQWYQTGGSDRTLIVRHLEFLRLLVRSGELELERNVLALPAGNERKRHVKGYSTLISDRSE